MRNRKLLAIAGLVMLTPLFLWAARRPDWVSGSSKQYPDKNYLVGVGIGDNLDAARSAARAEIAKIFQARVVQSAKDIKQETQTQQGRRRETSAKLETELATKVFTDEILQGVEISDTWFNAKKKVYYALATLNKLKTRATLTQQISEQENIIQTQIASLGNAVSSIGEVRALTRALQAWDEKEMLVAKKRVLEPVAMPDIASGPSRVEIQTKREEALRKILFVVDVPAEEGYAQVKGMISEQIAQMGFPVISSPEDKPQTAAVSEIFLVRCQLEVKPLDRGNPQWQFYNWQGTVEILEGVEQGKILTTVSRQGEVSHISAETARNKAFQEAAETLAQALKQQINQYILGSE